MKFLYILLATTTLLVQGCNSTARKDKPAYGPVIPAGAVLELHKTLEIEPQHTRLFVQMGQVIKHRDRNRFMPNCSFEVRELQQALQSIKPGQFTVSRTEIGTEQVVLNEGIKVAGTFESGAPVVARLTHFWLSSAHQPELFRLTCYGGEAHLPEADYPTWEEIKVALGSIATLK